MVRRSVMLWAVLVATAMGSLASCTPSESAADDGHTETTATGATTTTLGTTATDPSDPSDPSDLTEVFRTQHVDSAMIESALASLTEGDLARALRKAYGYQPVAAGRTGAAAPIGFGMTRQIVVRTPAGYTPDRSWPLIVAYHGWGGEPDVIIDRIEAILGDAIDGYVVAAPDTYRQTVIDAPPPVTSEHLSIWRAIRSEWNIDADRTYLAGYSLGGDTVITLTSMHPGHVAGGLSMAAGAAYPTDVPGLAETFWTQLRQIPILQVVGADDDLNLPGLNGRTQDITNAEQADLIADWVVELDLQRFRQRILDGVGHANAYPSRDEASAALSADRVALPPSFSHRFRYIHQADAWWIEGHEWLGDGWLHPWPEVEIREGEDEDTALTRTIFGLLGSIVASVDDQVITVDTQHLANYTIWLSDGMVDWESPVTVVADGVVVFDGVVDRSPAVAVAQAIRTLDFDRLRYAGIRVDPVAHTAVVVTADDEFPPVTRGITF